MAMLLKGAPAAEALNKKTAEKTAELKACGLQPRLALVRLGEREDDLAYERAAIKRCESLGIACETAALSEHAREEELIECISALQGRKEGEAGRPAVHGILLFMPLPPQIDAERVRASVLGTFDMDGITDASKLLLYSGDTAASGRAFPPCTAQGVLELLKFYDIPIAGRRAVVVGRSPVIGKPLSMLLLAENATVTMAHSRSEGLDEICRGADILIACAGKAALIGREQLREGQTVIDVGIHRDESGRLIGDVRFDEALEVLGEGGAITPVPGGVGAMTTSVLAAHVAEAASRQALKGDNDKGRVEYAEQ